MEELELSEALTEENGANSEKMVPQESEEAKAEREFLNTVRLIQERLQKLPSDIPVIKLSRLPTPNTKAMYLSLCNKLGVQKCDTFLRSINCEKMDLSYHSLGFWGVIPVMKALTLSSEVENLDLSYNNLDAQCLPAVAYLIEENANIKYLNFSGNTLCKGDIKQLKLLILKCHCVEILNLSNNKLNNQHLYAIGQTLVNNESIKELNLSCNDFGPENGKLFGTFIEKCRTLEKLDLSFNHFQEGAAGIFEGLRKNSALKVVNLSFNGIPDIATPGLASGIRGNKSLKKLDLSYNFLSSKGVKQLAPALRGNSVLKILKLAKNPIRGSGACRLIESIGGNIQLLDLCGIEVNVGFMKALRSLWNKGRVITVLYGNEIPYDTMCREKFRNKMDETVIENNPLAFAEKFADQKGVSLKKVLKTIHALFIAEIHAEALAAQEEAKGKEDESKKKKEKKAEAPKQQAQPRICRMTVEELAKALTSSELAMPRATASSLAAAFKDAEGYVDIWGMINNIKSRPNEIEIHVKRFKFPPREEEEKEKKK